MQDKNQETTESERVGGSAQRQKSQFTEAENTWI